VIGAAFELLHTHAFLRLQDLQQERQMRVEAQEKSKEMQVYKR
jgi:hypothetical protein